MVLADLAEFTHFVTRVKVVPAVADDISLSEAERVRGRDFAAKLSMRVLARAWQMLLKGIGEVQAPARPVAAAEMVLVRIAYAADLPTPDEVVRSLERQWRRRRRRRAMAAARRKPAAPAAAPRYEAPRGSPRSSAALSPRLAEPAPQRSRSRADAAIARFAELIALAAEKRDITIKMALERDVRLVHCEDGRLEIALEPHRAEDAGPRSVAQTSGLDRQALDGGGVERAGRADAARAGRGAPGRGRAWRAKAIRWCRRCSTASPAPRSSASRRAPGGR